MAEFRIMTWNVQNLLGVGHESGPGTADRLEAKIASLTAVVDEARPHVLAVQEVGTADVMEQFQAALTWKLPHLALGRPDTRGIRVGFCSKRVIRDPIDVMAFPPGLLPVQTGDDPDGSAGPPTMDGMGRGALQITVTANNHDLTLVTCHLKSKLLSYPGGRFFPRNEDERARFGAYALNRRSSEATTVRQWMTGTIADQGVDEPFVLLGDMNDEVEAATTQILNGPSGSEIGTRGFDVPDAGDRQRLWNLAPLIDPDRRATRRYRGRGELIDHMFVSRFLSLRTEAVTTVQAGGGPLPSIDDDPRGAAHLGSDHAAILASFNF